MYQVWKITQGVMNLIDSNRDHHKAQQRALEQSNLNDAVYVVIREGFGTALYAVWRGVMGDPVEVMRRMSAESVPPVQAVTLSIPDVEVIPVLLPDEPPVSDLTVTELRNLARGLNIPYRSNMGKAELIAAIDAARNEPGPNETKARSGGPNERKIVPATVISVDEAEGIVEAVVNTYGIIDDGDDRVLYGSAAKTLAENFGRIRVLNSHNNRNVLDVVGKPLVMRELTRDELPPSIQMRWPDATGGLYTKTQYLIDTPEGLGVFKRIAAGAVDEYSIGFDAIVTDMERITDPETGKQRTIRNIREVRLWEYSPVVWGMNPATTSISAKSTDDPDVPLSDPEPEPDSADKAQDQPDETKVGRVLSERNYNAIKQAYELLASVMQGAGLTDGDDADDMSADKSRHDSNEATDGPLPVSTDAPTSTEAGPQDNETPATKRTDLLKQLAERLANVEEFTQ